MSEHTIPSFLNEADEARWWFEHRDEIANDIVTASKKGALGQGSLSRREKILHMQNAVSTCEPGEVRGTR